MFLSTNIRLTRDMSMECHLQYIGLNHLLTIAIIPHFSDFQTPQFLAHLSMEFSVSYYDHSPSIIVRPTSVRPSIHNFLVNTLASTNINQSAPNLARMYMTIRSRMSFIMELIRPELSELSALELENLPYLTLFTL